MRCASGWLRNEESFSNTKYTKVTKVKVFKPKPLSPLVYLVSLVVRLFPLIGSTNVILPANPHEEPGMLPVEFVRLQEELLKTNAELAAAHAALRKTEEQLERRVEERTRELSTLLRVSHNITTTLELESLLGLILDQLKTVVDYTSASINSLEGDMLQAIATRSRLPSRWGAASDTRWMTSSIARSSHPANPSSFQIFMQTIPLHIASGQPPGKTRRDFSAIRRNQ